MDSKGNDIEIIINDKADEVIQNLFESLQNLFNHFLIDIK